VRNNKNVTKVNDADYIRTNARLIELSLESFGIFVRVAEIDIRKNFSVYYLDIGAGTDLEKLEKHDRDLAMVLASPTGKVYWQIPVPGKSYVGLKVPRPNKEYFEKIRLEKETRLKENNFRSKVAFVFFLIGQANYYLANKILYKDKLK